MLGRDAIAQAIRDDAKAAVRQARIAAVATYRDPDAAAVDAVLALVEGWVVEARREGYAECAANAGGPIGRAKAVERARAEWHAEAVAAIRERLDELWPRDVSGVGKAEVLNVLAVLGAAATPPLTRREWTAEDDAECDDAIRWWFGQMRTAIMERWSESESVPVSSFLNLLDVTLARMRPAASTPPTSKDQP